MFSWACAALRVVFACLPRATGRSHSLTRPWASSGIFQSPAITLRAPAMWNAVCKPEDPFACAGIAARSIARAQDDQLQVSTVNRGNRLGRQETLGRRGNAPFVIAAQARWPQPTPIRSAGKDCVPVRKHRVRFTVSCVGSPADPAKSSATPVSSSRKKPCVAKCAADAVESSFRTVSAVAWAPVNSVSSGALTWSAIASTSWRLPGSFAQWSWPSPWALAEVSPPGSP